jgi:hypothetical protein
MHISFESPLSRISRSAARVFYASEKQNGSAAEPVREEVSEVELLLSKFPEHVSQLVLDYSAGPSAEVVGWDQLLTLRPWLAPRELVLTTKRTRSAIEGRFEEYDECEQRHCFVACKAIFLVMRLLRLPEVQIASHTLWPLSIACAFIANAEEDDLMDHIHCWPMPRGWSRDTMGCLVSDVLAQLQWDTRCDASWLFNLFSGYLPATDPDAQSCADAVGPLVRSLWSSTENEALHFQIVESMYALCAPRQQSEMNEFLCFVSGSKRDRACVLGTRLEKHLARRAGKRGLELSESSSSSLPTTKRVKK